MARPSELLEVHRHLADAAMALAKAIGTGANARELLPLAHLITETQAELLRVTRAATPPKPAGPDAP